MASPRLGIFILCHNEEVLLPHTVRHYRSRLPACDITIYDNESTDKSVRIAKRLGCNVVSWGSNDRIDDFKYQEIKNNCWKSNRGGWVIVCDMDEWLCVTSPDLKKELKAGTTILRTEGYNMLGNSRSVRLDDIDLHSLKTGVRSTGHDKQVCFKRDAIMEINYGTGAHVADPHGIVQYSDSSYILKHIDMPGLPFALDKLSKRRKRSEAQRRTWPGLAHHYGRTDGQLTEIFHQMLTEAAPVKNLPPSPQRPQRLRARHSNCPKGRRN